ncbi:MAG: phytanoyl-CoA dioxygenase family protein, partial [Bacteroidota bacterium]|nr:phytanoyl-CoA dioxygenase family protein [Bacteroidota bacterium]
MKYQINNKDFQIEVNGARSFGNDEVLFLKDDNLIAHTSWQKEGFTLFPLLDSADFDFLNVGLKTNLTQLISKYESKLPSNFKIEDYHQVVSDNQALHLAIINEAKQVDYQNFPIPIETIIEQVEEEVKIPLTVLNPNTKEYHFSYRIVRPGKSDFNALHRDAWHPELKNCLNLFLPVAGSNELSSLCLIPGSHYWPEKTVERTLAGAIMNGSQYTVPGLTATSNELKLVRPNPVNNQALLFTPYLIHGGAANLNEDTT